MALLSLNEMTTYRWTFDEDVRRYAAAGIPALGVWRSKLSDFGEERGIDLVRESGLRVSSLMWACGFTGSDGRSFQESLEDDQEAVRLAGELEAESLIIYSGARGGHTSNHARRLVRTALCELASLADECGVNLALEPVHEGCGAEWTFLNRLDDALALLATVDHPRVKLAFDTYHLCHEGGILFRLAELAPQIAIVHLGDARAPPCGEQNRCRLGEGILPLREVIEILTASGYRGYFEVELLGEEFEGIDAASLVTHARVAFAQLSGHSAP